MYGPTNSEKPDRNRDDVKARKLKQAWNKNYDIFKQETRDSS